MCVRENDRNIVFIILFFSKMHLYYIDMFIFTINKKVEETELGVM